MTTPTTPPAQSSMVSKQGQTAVVPDFSRSKGDLGFGTMLPPDGFVENADQAYKPITIRRK